MALFNADITVSIDRTTATLKYDNHGRWASNAAHPRIMDEVRDRLIAYIEHKLDFLITPVIITEKTRIKGITELSNILTG